MTLDVITDATTEPCTAAELRAWLSLDSAAQDTLLLSLIKAARNKIERYTGIGITTRTLKYILKWPAEGEIDLPYAPITTVDEVQVYDTDGTLTTVDAGDYSLIDTTLTYTGGIGYTVSIKYTVGETTIPEDQKQLILKQAAFDYLHRGDDDAPLMAPDVLAELQAITRNLGY